MFNNLLFSHLYLSNEKYIDKRRTNHTSRLSSDALFAFIPLEKGRIGRGQEEHEQRSVKRKRKESQHTRHL